MPSVFTFFFSCLSSLRRVHMKRSLSQDNPLDLFLTEEGKNIRPTRPGEAPVANESRFCAPDLTECPNNSLKGIAEFGLECERNS